MRRDIEAKVNALDNRLRGMLAKTSTFVSIDIVDSTGLKMNESEEDVIFSFLAYQKLTESLIGQHAGQVVSITGDGVMAKFAIAQDAVSASLHLLGEMPEFNRSTNLLKNPVNIRIGINTGKVFEDSAESRLTCQLLPSKAIDMAGYLQKRAPVNGIFVSQFTMEQMERAMPGLVKDHYDEKIGFVIYAFHPGGTEGVAPAPAKLIHPKVLIIEDEPDQAFKLARLFTDSKFEADIAFDGVDGLIHYRAFEPHVVLIDIGLPRIDGWNVLHEMKNSKLAAAVPILMLARRYKVDDIERSLELGASGCIKKPWDDQRLLRKVQSLIHGTA